MEGIHPRARPAEPGVKTLPAGRRRVLSAAVSQGWMQPLSFLGSQENPVPLDLAPTRGF